MRREELYRHLRLFRWRTRLVLAWRYAAMGGAVGAAIALLADIGDWRGAWTVEPVTLVAFIVLGILLGVAYALWRSLPAEAIGQLIDRRAKLKDRVTTALLCADNPFIEPLHEDALMHLQSIRPSQVFRFRLTVWHVVTVILIAAVVISRFFPSLPLSVLASFRQDRKEAKNMVEQVKRVLKPITEHAKNSEASDLEKRLAKQLQALHRRANYGRLSKKEALVKLNKLLSEAQKLERQRQQQFQKVSTKFVTAAKSLQQHLGQKFLASQMNEMQKLLQRMREIERQLKSSNLTSFQRQLLEAEKRLLQQTMQAMGQLNAQQQKQLMSTLQAQLTQLQKMLQSGLNLQGKPLTEPEKQMLRQQLESLQKQMQALQLSKEAQEFLRKLFSDPNYQEAMRRLAELQKQLQEQIKCLNQGQMPKLSPEELERMLREMEKALEELAKKYGSDEAIRQLAKQLLEAVKNLKLSQNKCQNCNKSGFG